MPVLTRTSLEASPLADLHALAAELQLDGFRRLRKADLVDAILERQGGEDDAEPETEADAAAPAEEEEAPRRTRGRRGGRGRRKGEEDGATDEDAGTDGEAEAGAEAEAEAEAPQDAEEDERPARSRRGRGGRGRDRDRDRDEDGDERPARSGREPEEERVAEGVVELLDNGSGFVRVSPPEPSEDDVYISAAQVRRCELVNGDRVSGPVRKPRRSERYPSLVRIDTINGAPADEVAEGTPYDELPCAFPSERFALGSEDPTLKAIEWLTPFGRGSRVVVTGAQGAGKSEALRLIAAALKDTEGVEVTAVLAGVRAEELGAWRETGVEIAGAQPLGASAEALGQVVERAAETAKRVAARGGHAVLLVDTLDGVHPPAARRALAAARNLENGGSLTVVAAAAAPLGGETTVIALDARLTGSRRFPALDLGASLTLRPELLVGDAGADAVAEARAQALGL
jgi:transcription termination factor Rho